MEHVLQIRDLALLREYATAYGQQGDDYIVCRLELPHGMPEVFMQPSRVSGLCLALLLKGDLQVEINFTPFQAQAKSLVSFGHGGTIKFSPNPRNSDQQIEYLFLSPQFLHDLNIDLNAINIHEMAENRPSPVINDITEQEMSLIRHYLTILYRNATDGNEAAFAKNIARSVTQALFYQLLQILSNHHNARDHARDSQTPQSRQIFYVQEFMRLLQLHHKSHRSISFYSDKLFISSKYLSHIIKTSTGRSATEWIAQFVISEAKNQLRYANKSIQQVAFDLNFTTQSAFGKYFKHVTGISPSEFQKT